MNNFEFIPFDPRNGLDFKSVDVNPETGFFELRECGQHKILTLEEFEKLKLLVSPNVRWIIGRYSNMLSYRYCLEMDKENKIGGANGLHKS